MSGNLYAIFSLAVIIILIFLTVILYQAHYAERKDSRAIINSLTKDAIFIALIAIMTFVPNLGFLSFFGGIITFTLLHLPVLLGASLMGWKRGALYGLLFGLASWIKALTAATGAFDMFFMNPLVSVLPRFLFGLIAGLAFDFLKRIKSKGLSTLSIGIASLVCTIIHSCLVFLSIYIFTRDEAVWFWQWLFAGDAYALGMTALAVTALGALGEAILAFFFVPTLHTVLVKAMPKSWPSMDKGKKEEKNA